MATLNSTHKEFIIKKLACMNQPVDVIEELKEEFGIEVSRPQISFYNPETANGTRLSKKWRHLFYDTRRRYVTEIAGVPIANQGFRLNEMQRNYDKAKKAGNIVLAQQILEQAAKEVGGVFEQKSLILPGEGGGNFFQQINQTIINQQNNKNG